MRRVTEPAADDALGAPTDPDEIPMVDTLWTWPNLFTLIRLLCLPLFVWLLFGLPSRQAAAWLLGSIGMTDWVDGYLARKLGQSSEFGKKFDPTVDRIWFVTALVAIIINGAMPLWIAILILAREVIVGGTIAVATLFFKMEPFDVTWWGKTATFFLMMAVPGFLMAESSIPIAVVFEVIAWVVVVPGLILSYYTAVAYIPAIRDGIRRGRAAAA